MRILVGTIYSGENEFSESVEAVKRQRYGVAEHLVIQGLPLQEAAHSLFAKFFSPAREFDLLVKVDADMVLAHEGIFEGIVSRFESDERLQLLSIGVRDFYTDQIIGSLNAYRSTIEWVPDFDPLAPDRVTVPRDRRAYDHTSLAPAAWHCPNPSPLQAFHYGLHRGAKAYAAARRRDSRQLRAQLGMFEKTWRHYRRKPDRRLVMAALGGEVGLTGRFGGQFVSYADPGVAEAFRTYEHHSTEQLESEVRRFRRRSFGFLPDRWRLEVLRDGRLTLPLRLLVPYAIRRRAAKAATRTLRRVAAWTGLRGR